VQEKKTVWLLLFLLMKKAVVELFKKAKRAGAKKATFFSTLSNTIMLFSLFV
jgi:hypothetical protein